MTFTPKTTARVHRYASGIPRLINLICDRALLSAYSNRTARIVPAFVDAAAESLALHRRKRFVRAWVRQRFGAFAAGLVVAAALTAGAAAAWHYRDNATRMVKMFHRSSDQVVADRQ